VSELLSASDLWASFAAPRRMLRGGSREPITALRGVSLSIRAQSRVGIVGESGAGKSTLAKMLAGIILPDRGSIRYAGELLDARRGPRVTRAIQMIFQDPGSSLNPALSVGRVLSELLRFHGLVAPDRVEDRCRELVALVQLPQRVLGSRPRELSGGERQRVAIARALAVEPRILIADEVVSALDTSVQAAIMGLLGELSERLGVTIISIAHDLAIMPSLCEEVLVMHRGQIVERGPIADVFHEPAHEHTRALLKAAPRLLSEVPAL
jgi:ABC-type glutathione transport system ATPase component